MFSDVGPYDYASLMHYWAGAFSTDPGSCTADDTSGCTIIPVDPDVSPAVLGAGNRLSDLDASGICEVYGSPAFLRVFTSDGTRLDLFDDESVFIGADEPLELEFRTTWRGVREAAPIRISSDVDGVVYDTIVTSITDGDTITLADLSAGVHRITVETLSDCRTAFDFELEVDPGFAIVSPADESEIVRGTNISLRVDARGLGPDASVRWESDVDGLLTAAGGDTVVSARRLTPGAHVLTASATLPSGDVVTDSVDIEVLNQAPIVEIVAPVGGTFCVDAPVRLVANVWDLDFDEVAEDDVRWSLDGDEIATGRATTETFDAAVDGTLEVEATDALGSSASDTQPITVEVCEGTPPLIEVTLPPSDRSVAPDVADYYYEGWDGTVPGDPSTWYRDLAVSARAVDGEDGVLTGDDIVWRTNASGSTTTLGTGTGFTARFTGSCGGATQTLTVTATDSDGNEAARVLRVVFTQLC